jgi:hypothetical protein
VKASVVRQLKKVGISSNFKFLGKIMYHENKMDDSIKMEYAITVLFMKVLSKFGYFLYSKKLCQRILKYSL